MYSPHTYTLYTHIQNHLQLSLLTIFLPKCPLLQTNIGIIISLIFIISFSVLMLLNGQQKWHCSSIIVLTADINVSPEVLA